jgi:lauroyl/myristoyl acyltransferase
MSRLTEIATAGAHAVLGAMPTPLASGSGATLSRLLLPRLYPGSVRRGEANLARLRPDLDAAARAALLEEAVGNLGRTMAEVPRINRVGLEDRLEVAGEEHLRAVLAQGRSVMLPLLHLGNWEIVAGYCARFGVPFHTVYQPPRNASEHEIVRRTRLATGVNLLMPGINATQQVLGALRRGGEIVGMFADAQMADRRISGPAFWRPMPQRGNMVTITRMVAMTGAAMVPMVTERLPGPRFRVTSYPEIPVPDLAQGLPAVNAALEALLLPRLGQWFMLFRLGMGEAG